jgi:hypothetical protein
MSFDVTITMDRERSLAESVSAAEHGPVRIAPTIKASERSQAQSRIRVEFAARSNAKQVFTARNCATSAFDR